MNRNRYICHSCRKSEHWFNDYPNKRLCPKCWKGFLKWFEVYRTHNEGKLFHNCSAGCGHFEFDDEATMVQSEEGEDCGSSSTKTGAVDETIELSRILKVLANITEENDVKLSVKLTISKEKRSSDDEDDEDKGKEKGKML